MDKALSSKARRSTLSSVVRRALRVPPRPQSMGVYRYIVLVSGFDHDLRCSLDLRALSLAQEKKICPSFPLSTCEPGGMNAPTFGAGLESAHFEAMSTGDAIRSRQARRQEELRAQETASEGLELSPPRAREHKAPCVSDEKCARADTASSR